MLYEPDDTMPLKGTFVVSPTNVTPGIRLVSATSRVQNARLAVASG
jgi:hypothetical protein